MKHIKNGTIRLLLFGGGILLLSGVSYGFDFNLNTVQTDLRARAGTPDNPGFDPCRDGTRDAGGQCTGAATGLLRPSNLTSAFPALGPGAVTDNMFGRVGDVSANPTQCAANANPGDAFNANSLNCGNTRLTPTNQGQTLPTAPLSGATAINTLTGTGFTANTNLFGDFCANGATDCDPDGAGGPLLQTTAAHTGFDMINNFTWTPTSASAATVVLVQQVKQVTALTTPVGTLGVPGNGDQLLLINTNNGLGNTSTASSSSVDGTFANPTISWTQTISDPDMSGVGVPFTQTISGSFVYNSAGASASYPTGSSQTVRSTGGTPSTETLSFP